MHEQYQRQPLTVPSPPPPTPLRYTIMGKVLYPKGPWGSRRPLRHRGAILVREGRIFDPRNVRPNEKRPTGTPEQVLLAPTGNIVSFYKGPWRSWEIWTEGDGSFRLTTDAIDPNTPGLVLVIRDYNFVSAPGRDVYECFYSLVPGPIDLSAPNGAPKWSSQGAGTLRVPWFPPPFMVYIATVNGQAFADTQKLARQMCSLVRSPSYPAKIKLLRESELSQQNVKGEDYSYGELLFEDMAKGRLAPGFPARVVNEVARIPRLQVQGRSTAETIAMMLERLVTVNIDQLENTKELVDPLINALESAMGGSHKYQVPLADVPQDMAAAIVLLGIAGMIARDNAKPAIQFSSQDLANSQKILSVEISVTK